MMKLEEAVEALAPGVLRYCMAVTGDRALAEDVSQDALTALVDRWKRLGAPDSVDAFVFSVARRRAARALAKRRLLAPIRRFRNGHSADPRPDERAAERQRLERTMAAMGSLSPRERQALQLVVVGGLSSKEAATLLRTSEGALKMRLHRARKRLSELLEERDDR